MAASSEHTFPIPATEQHKLDEVKEIIRHPPVGRESAGGVRGHSWVVVSLLGFVLLGVGWVRKRLGGETWHALTGPSPPAFANTASTFVEASADESAGRPGEGVV